MSLALAFWILMLLWFVLHGITAYLGGWEKSAYSGHVLPFILFLLLGWKVFGAPLHG